MFCESLPILELLEETYPDSPKLLPSCSIDKHRMRQICEVINAGMQPLSRDDSSLVKSLRGIISTEMSSFYEDFHYIESSHESKTYQL